MKTVLLPIAWILVLAPLSWGVARSVQRSMPLFTGGTTAAPEKSVPTGPAGPASTNRP